MAVMKTIKRILIILLVIASMGAAAAFLYYINPEPFGDIEKLIPKQQKETALEHAKKHTDPNYVCPMHPQIVKGEPGNCPICGMDLVKKETPTENKPEKSNKKEKKLLYWVAPMDPNFRRDKPGKSPMGMDLVPVYDEGNSASSNDKYPAITVKHSIAQSMGIRTTTVQKEALSRKIKTVGFMSYNEDKLQHVHVRTEGWVENVMVKSQGDYVKKGSILFDYYSPELLAAQEDYLIALKGIALYSEAGQARLIESAKKRMRLIGVPESIIKTITKTKKSIKNVPVYAPTSGTITRLEVRKGANIVPATELYSIEDLDSIWVIVDVFEHQLSWVKVGNPATILVEALGDKEWTGRVDYIYPELAPMTRTLRVRLVFDNPKGRFKPNMFANVTIQGTVHDSLVVPNEAIILAEGGKRVVKVTGENEYQPVTIRTGIKSGGKTEVLEGLKAGDKIVVSSQFLLDSESNLQASFRRLSE